jgi:hypothetical protein
MTMFPHRTPLRLTLCLALALAALQPAARAAAADDPRSLPGYIDLDWVRIPAGASEIQDVTLDPVLAGLAARSDGASGEALNRALAMVKSVRLKSFSLGGGREENAVAADVKKLQERLEKDKWQRLVYVKDGDETLTISTLYRGELMVGLLLLSYEPGHSATFVNVCGDLDLATLLQLAGQMHGEQLEGLMKGFDPHGDQGELGEDSGDDAGAHAGAGRTGTVE